MGPDALDGSRRGRRTSAGVAGAPSYAAGAPDPDRQTTGGSVARWARDRSLGVGMGISALDGVSYGLLVPLLPFVVLRYGGGPVLVTQLVAFYGLAGFVGAPLLGALGDRIGRPLVLNVALLALAMTFAGMLAADSLALVFGFRILSGALAGHGGILRALVIERRPATQQVDAISWLAGAGAVGASLGPAIGAGLAIMLAEPGLQFRAAVAGSLAASLVMLILSVLAWRGGARGSGDAMGAPPKVAPRRSRVSSSLIAPLLLVFLTAYAHGVLISVTALLVHARFDWGIKETGLLLALATAIIAGMRFFAIGPLVAALGVRRVLLGSVLVGAGALAEVGLSTSPGPFLAAFCAFVCADAFAAVLPTGLASMAASADNRGFVMGLAQGVAALAGFLSAGLNGLLFGEVAPFAPHLAGALALAAAAGLILTRWSRPGLARQST